MTKSHCELCEIKKLYNEFIHTLDIDKFKTNTGAYASVYVRRDDDFIIVSSSLKNTDDTSTSGTLLDRDSEPYKKLILGRKYVGDALLFGKKYTSKYSPLITEGDKVVVAVFVGTVKVYDTVK